MLQTANANIRIILVEPAGPLNVGSVARVMKNMGLHQLILVNPQCDHLGEEARLMAVRAADILENARVVESLPAALVGCTRAIATTGDDRPIATKREDPADALPWLLEAPSALIFGREDCGLTNAELNYAQRLIRIPSSDAYTSLNLAQAVAVCCYELYKSVVNPSLQVNPPLPPPLGENQEPPPRGNEEDASATFDNLEGYYQKLETVLLKIGYLHPHTAASRMAKFRHLYNRAYPTVDEVAMLRGTLRQIEWALKTCAIAPVSDSLDGALPDCPGDTQG
ncbi:RNA methyltransferase [Tychonema sp. BBK16]|uniref:RNA methyltransferase n=1 Tax=Tychonema sp. BBK16 TaxID=2699888 RepID=UPI001F41FC1C|nr:RNA methyltransferase [Tychonema sp. BBK16]MCF6374467.1 RNA methyltransferase [Tychonema sp. BBK16]